MSIYNCIRNNVIQAPCRRFLTTPQLYQKSIQVTVLGAHTPLGRFTSFLLKQNPLVSYLRIQGDKGVKNLAVDLGLIDTKCKVEGFEGSLEISNSVRSSDVILVLGAEQLSEDTSIADRVLKEGKRVCNIAKECTIHAPRSIIVVAVPPVSVTTVLVEFMFKETHWYHPGRIIGSAAIAQIKANTLMGRMQGLDPQICNIPLIGGPDTDLAVPLFSKASPVEVPLKSAKDLMLKFRGIRDHQYPKVMGRPNFLENCPTSEAYALWNMISTIGLGLCGDQKAYCNAYVRANLINTCKHLVTTVQLSRGGFVHNCGIPWLTPTELEMFERAALDIKDREEMAREFLCYITGDSSQPPPPFKQKELELQRILQQTVIGG